MQLQNMKLQKPQLEPQQNSDNVYKHLSQWDTTNQLCKNILKMIENRVPIHKDDIEKTKKIREQVKQLSTDLQTNVKITNDDLFILLATAIQFNNTKLETFYAIAEPFEIKPQIFNTHRFFYRPAAGGQMHLGLLGLAVFASNIEATKALLLDGVSTTEKWILYAESRKAGFDYSIAQIDPSTLGDNWRNGISDYDQKVSLINCASNLEIARDKLLAEKEWTDNFENAMFVIKSTREGNTTDTKVYDDSNPNFAFITEYIAKRTNNTNCKMRNTFTTSSTIYDTLVLPKFIEGYIKAAIKNIVDKTQCGNMLTTFTNRLLEELHVITPKDNKFNCNIPLSPNAQQLDARWKKAEPTSCSTSTTTSLPITNNININPAALSDNPSALFAKNIVTTTAIDNDKSNTQPNIPTPNKH